MSLLRSGRGQRVAVATGMMIGLFLIWIHRVPAEEPMLKFEVKPRSTTIPRYGRLWLDLKLINQGQRSVTVYFGDRADPHVFAFRVTDPDGKATPASQLFDSTHPSRAGYAKYFRTIQPGASVAYRVVLGPTIASNAQGVAFSQPGTYQIDCQLNVVTDHEIDESSGQLHPVADAWTGSLEGPSLDIDVTLPIDPSFERNYGEKRLSGVVKDDRGKPLANARVTPEYRLLGGGGLAGSYWSRGPSVLTDAQGRYVVGDVTNKAMDYRLHARHPAFPTKIAMAANNDKLVQQLNLQFDQPATLQGKVVDEQGNGLFNVRVTYGFQSSTYTNAAGEFLIPNARRMPKYSLMFYRRGWSSKDLQVDRDKAEAGKLSVVMQPERLRQMHGQATLQNAPLKMTTLDFWFWPAGTEDKDSAKNNVRVTTDLNGRFTVLLPTPDSYDMMVQAHVSKPRPMAWSMRVDGIAPSDGIVPLVVRAVQHASVDGPSRVAAPGSQSERCVGEK